MQSRTVTHPLAPLLIGVTGHRDLVDAEVPLLEARIAAFFAELSTLFPHTPLCLMTALAEGADRLAARIAVRSGTSLVAVLPMPLDDYRRDFESAESRAEFDELLAAAEVLELPHTRDQLVALKEPGPGRDLSYAHSGMFISAHCHVLLALWDGVESDSVGGTSQIIYFQHYDRLPGVAESVPRTSLFLTDDESDLVYHLSCSRQSRPSAAATPATGDACWFTTDPDRPRMSGLPARYLRVFARADDYNRDILRIRDAATTVSLDDGEAPPHTRTEPAARRIFDYFRVADLLANQYQRRVSVTLTAIYAFALLTGLAFLLYSELSGAEPLIYAFLLFLLASSGIAAVAKRRQWHRKYLDYRVLAEGLRVQYYWAVAGIHGEGYTKFAYDNFLRQRDMELGWIRNVMRAAGTVSDAQPNIVDESGLRFAIRHWIGTENEAGQLDYYRRGAAQRSRVNRATAIITHICLWGGVLVAVVLAARMHDLAPATENALIILMGILPLVAGIAEVYTQRKADRELTKQYAFMEHVFRNARRRLREARTENERREVLQGLGEAALSEHAEWILVHRERQPEPTGL